MCYWITIRFRDCQHTGLHDVHGPRRECNNDPCAGTGERIELADTTCPHCSDSPPDPTSAASYHPSNSTTTVTCDWWCERTICATLNTDCSRCSRKTKEVIHVGACAEGGAGGEGCIMEHIWNMTDGDECSACHPELAGDGVCRFCKRTPEQREQDRDREADRANLNRRDGAWWCD